MATKLFRPGETPGITRERVELNGLNCSYLQGVPLDGKIRQTIILIHGWPDCSYGWRHQFEPLMKLGFRIIALDSVGYGHTDAPRVPPASLQLYSFKQAADNVKALTQHLGLTKIILGGHDWGGYTVYRIYQYYPELVTHIFSIAVPYIPPWQTSTSLEEFITQFPGLRYQLQLASGVVEEKLTTKEDLRKFVNALYGGTSADGTMGFSMKEGVLFQNLDKIGKSPILSEKDIDYYVNEYSRNGLHGPCNWYRTVQTNSENDQHLGLLIPIPILYIKPLKEQLVSEEFFELIQGLAPNMTVKPVNTGHWAMAEDPASVNEFMTTWLRDVVLSGSPKV